MRQRSPSRNTPIGTLNLQLAHSPTSRTGELGLLLFGLYLVYKLRNAKSDTHKEKLILCLAVALELVISLPLYTLRHALWNKFANNDHLLLLYAARCHLTVTLTVALVFWPKVSALRRSHRLSTGCQSRPSRWGAWKLSSPSEPGQLSPLSVWQAASAKRQASRILWPPHQAGLDRNLKNAPLSLIHI